MEQKDLKDEFEIEDNNFDETNPKKPKKPKKKPKPKKKASYLSLQTHWACLKA